MESTSQAETTTSTGSNLLRIVGGVVLLVLLVATARMLPVGEYLDDILVWLQGVGLAGAIVFGVLYVAATVAFIPASVLTLGAGYAFGVLWGTVLVSIASTAGAALAFVIGRYFARDWVRDKIAARPTFQAIDNALERDDFKVVFLLRLVPLLPFNALNYGFGVSGVRFWRYVVASWVGMIPGTIMYVYFGSLAEKVTRLAAGAPEAQLPVWAVGETLQRAFAGDVGGGVLQNLFYWLGLVATVAVVTLITRRAKKELDRLTETEEAEARPTTEQTSTFEGRTPLEPTDEYNRTLQQKTHPTDRTNPPADETYNLVAIGAGTAGLVGAAGASSLGARSALIEREYMGGDCLVSGCVPSKGVIRSARAAHGVRHAEEFGVHVDGEVRVDFAEAMERMRRVRAEISEEDSLERFESLGVDVFLGDATFVDERTVEVGDRRIQFNHALIATGGRPMVPPIEGLEDAGYLTNETVFSLTERPDRFAVVGGGPIGCELAQAFQRLGADVTLLEMTDQLLPREDDEASAVVERALRDEGVEVRLESQLARVAADGDTKRLTVERTHAGPADLRVDDLLIAAGRRPNVEGLGLEAAGVEHDQSGIVVDERLRTTNSHIWAAGDVASPYKFTHVADAQARLVLRNALFPGSGSTDDLVVPWCTYTSPEVAHVGLEPEEAREKGYDVETVRQDLEDVHRARIEGETDGFLKVHLRAGTDEILGATLVSEDAGDLISELTLAIEGDVGLGTLADTIHPYPTTAAVHKRAADEYNRTRMKPWMTSVLEWWFGLWR